jgi:hypothetical protein
MIKLIKQKTLLYNVMTFDYFTKQEGETDYASSNYE